MGGGGGVGGGFLTARCGISALKADAVFAELMKRISPELVKQVNVVYGFNIKGACLVHVVDSYWGGVDLLRCRGYRC